MLLAQGTRSLQCALNDLIPQLGLGQRTVSKAAYSKARHKLNHTAFIELNQVAVVKTMYETSDYQTWKDLRILAVDGSKVMLPTSDETVSEFGVIRYDNGQDTAKGAGKHAYAVASVLYDVLNRVAIDATLAPAHAYEVDLAAGHLGHTKTGDLVIYDRGYCSYRMMTMASGAPGDFLIRCPAKRFRIATDMLLGNGPDDVVVTLTAPAGFSKDSSNQGLPVTLIVRFVRVTLDNGEYEVLATSLLDQQLYTPADFKELYYLRWGIETFYGILKTRLGLENFSGYSPEAIRQDFYATVFLTGAETILTEDAEEQLGAQRAGQPKKVNKAMSFSAIRDQAFELFYSKAADEQRLAALTELFLTSPTLIRPDRRPPRVTSSAQQRLSFWKRKRKTI
jgi:Transposase DDE domain